MVAFRDIRQKNSISPIVREIPQTSIQRKYRPRKPINFKRIGIFFAFALMAAFGINFAMRTIKAASEFSVELGPGLNRVGVAERIGDALGWNEKEKNVFAGTHAQMAWMAFNSEALENFSRRFGWGETEKEAFLTLSTRYIEPEYDFLALTYSPGSYTFKGNAGMAEVADTLISKSQFDGDNLREDAVLKVKELVQKEIELLPDLVPLPAKDVQIDRRGADVLLSFSTIYFNQGKGPLELIADPNTKGIRNDIQRDVLQRIYRKDGGYRERVAGTFLWHQEHLHYHFADFVIYDLEAVEVENPPDLSGFRTKSTFCIRDVSRVDENYQIENRREDAKYKICGKEMQGISVGWGDTYFYSYVDQNLNITDLPSGIYRLTFVANPSARFEESNMDNNKSSVLLDLDMKKFTVKVLKEEPESLPSVEHVYEEQVF